MMVNFMIWSYCWHCDKERQPLASCQTGRDVTERANNCSDWWVIQVLSFTCVPCWRDERHSASHQSSRLLKGETCSLMLCGGRGSDEWVTLTPVASVTAALQATTAATDSVDGRCWRLRNIKIFNVDRWLFNLVVVVGCLIRSRCLRSSPHLEIFLQHSSLQIWMKNLRKNHINWVSGGKVQKRRQENKGGGFFLRINHLLRGKEAGRFFTWWRRKWRKSEEEINKDRWRERRERGGRQRGGCSSLPSTYFLSLSLFPSLAFSLHLVLLWPCPACSLSHFLFLTWNLYLEPSLLLLRICDWSWTDECRAPKIYPNGHSL